MTEVAWGIIVNPKNLIHRIDILDQAHEFVAEIWYGAPGEAARADGQRYDELIEELGGTKDRMITRNVANDLARLRQGPGGRIH